MPDQTEEPQTWIVTDAIYIGGDLYRLTIQLPDRSTKRLILTKRAISVENVQITVAAMAQIMEVIG